MDPLLKSWMISLAMASAGCLLFLREWMRNRRLKADADRRLRLLADTMPAAVLLVDHRGVVTLVNRAAAELFHQAETIMVGSPVGAFLPGLYGLFLSAPEPDRTVRCDGHRGKGESFPAEILCSAFHDGLSVVTVKPATEDQAVHSLAPREHSVLYLVAQGLSNKEIAARLDLTESRVKGTLQQLFAKAGVRTRAQLVRVALKRYRDLIEQTPPPAPSAGTPSRQPAWHPRKPRAIRNQRRVILMDRRDVEADKPRRKLRGVQ